MSKIKYDYTLTISYTYIIKYNEYDIVIFKIRLYDIRIYRIHTYMILTCIFMICVRS